MLFIRLSIALVPLAIVNIYPNLVWDTVHDVSDSDYASSVVPFGVLPIAVSY